MDLYTPYPQILENIPRVLDLEDAKIANCINKINDRLHGNGRIVVRKSGTEPVTRVMIEAETNSGIERAKSMLNSTIRSVTT